MHPTYHMKKDNVEIICIEGNVLESKPTVVYLPDNVCMITDQNTAPMEYNAHPDPTGKKRINN